MRDHEIKTDAGNKSKKRFIHALGSFVISFISLVLMTGFALFILITFVASPFSVKGDGMGSNIPSESFVVANKVAYLTRDPGRGDVIISDGRILRIIAFAGEEVMLYGGHVYVNGRVLNEEYLDAGDHTYPIGDKNEFTVPGESYFVLCDNRACYDDSRGGLYVKHSSLSGKVIAVFKNNF